MAKDNQKAVEEKAVNVDKASTDKQEDITVSASNEVQQHDNTPPIGETPQETPEITPEKEPKNTVKEATKAQKEKAAKLFKSYPHAKALFFTSDITGLFTENDAKNHALKLKDAEVVKISRK